jgi:hypothetical protein
MVPGIDTCKDPGEALNLDGIPKYVIVEEVGLEMIVRFTWTKGMSCVYNRTIVRGESFQREKVGSIIRGLWDGQGRLDPCLVSVGAVETAIAGTSGPIIMAHPSGG